MDIPQLINLAYQKTTTLKILPESAQHNQSYVAKLVARNKNLPFLFLRQIATATAIVIKVIIVENTDISSKIDLEIRLEFIHLIDSS